jgi:hypothetical protein
LLENPEERIPGRRRPDVGLSKGEEALGVIDDLRVELHDCRFLGIGLRVVHRVEINLPRCVPLGLE